MSETPFAPIAFPVPAPAGGSVSCQVEDDEVFTWYLHTGARIAWQAPGWAEGRILLHVIGGHAAEPGFLEEGAAFLISRESLRALAADLLAVADGA